jgi:hypothetical protein
MLADFYEDILCSGSPVWYPNLTGISIQPPVYEKFPNTAKNAAQIKKICI